MVALRAERRRALRVTLAFDIRFATAPVADALASARTDWPTRPTLTWWAIDRPTLVLGSAQPATTVDAVAAAAAGVEVVRRASGGGAVLLDPHDVVWADLVIPPGHPRWDDDVIAAARWVGDAWVEALVALGLPADTLECHHGGLVRSRWSDSVCFAGLGPGEVRMAGRKVVGISQRRTRAGARFQMAVLRRWDPVGIVALLAVDDAARASAVDAIAGLAAGAPFAADALRHAFSSVLA